MQTSSHQPPAFDGRPNSIPRAFTLIEVMVVAVIVLLMLGLALPVFRAITGSRSEAGAANQISATLSRARADAIGLQKTIGVAFAFNNSTQLEDMAEVELADCPVWSPTGSYAQGTYVYYAPTGLASATQLNSSPYYFCISPQQATLNWPGSSNWQALGGPPLELRPDTDVIPMPAGIGVQTVCNCTVDTSVTPNRRKTDGYLNFGVILFDGQGRMTCQNYGVSSASKLATAASLSTDFPVRTAGIRTPSTSSNYGVPSQFGLVVFQRDAFNAQKSSVADPFYTTAIASQPGTFQGSGSPTPEAEEIWLDNNATPLVIDRYTGTLIRGE